MANAERGTGNPVEILDIIHMQLGSTERLELAQEIKIISAWLRMQMDEEETPP